MNIADKIASANKTLRELSGAEEISPDELFQTLRDLLFIAQSQATQLIFYKEQNKKFSLTMSQYGSQLGITYPAARAAMFARAELIDLMEKMRSGRRYQDADALRNILINWTMPLIDTSDIFNPDQVAINESLSSQALKSARREGNRP